MDLLPSPTSVKSTEAGYVKKPQIGSLLTELGELFTGDHLNASAGIQYSHKNFGRDSAISALFLLDSLRFNRKAEYQVQARQVIEAVITSLIRWQGQKPAKVGGLWRRDAEEPGKIHHEAGPMEIDEIGLAAKWQEADDKDSKMLVYFGSIDSTPLFICLISDYCAYLKSQSAVADSVNNFMLTEVQNFRGANLTVLDSYLAALGWLERELKSSELGLLEYQRRPGQEQGLINQSWKDSLTSYVHLDGSLANSAKPIASIEVQALAYDALISAVELLGQNQALDERAGVDKTLIDRWQDAAAKLKNQLIGYFWLEHEQRFCQAIDRDPRGGLPRVVATPSSNELHLLNSRLFDEMSRPDRQKYLESLVRAAMSSEFLTDLGIRCRGKSYYRLIDFADYHGSWSVWPWESHWIASGLRRQGFVSLADELDRRIFNAFSVSGEYLEYYLVDPRDDKSYYTFKPADWNVEKPSPAESIAAATIPDSPQTWSLTAAIDIRAILSSARPSSPRDELWMAVVEKELLLKIEHAPLLDDPQKAKALRSRSDLAVIDRRGGQAADHRYYRFLDGLTPTLLPAV